MESCGFSFDREFEALTGYPPMSWQRRLFAEHFATFDPSDPDKDTLPHALDIPTGLGKTAVMAIWYLARKAGVRAPRRLVYVVDRRAVVDQATEVADSIKRHDTSLHVSTLRGRYVDNREWLESPTTAAIIVGTVDMIGSRLLFSGYGVSRGMRPYHAGLLGADSLVVLDEAHLVPPFEALLKAITRDRDGKLGPAREQDRELVPRLHLLSLSATGRTEKEVEENAVFDLSEQDRNHPIAKQRLEAEKRLTLHEAKDAKALGGELAERAWRLATEPGPARVLVFCNSRDDALKVKDEIEKCAKKEKIESPSQLLVGERRVHEREELFKWLKDHGFVDGTGKPPEVPTFLVATSAGEVGVDLDADHMVCDLVEWERMVQRLGRVNRRGGEGRTAAVEIVAAPPKTDKKDGEKWPDRLERLRKPIGALNGDGSPAAIVALRKDDSVKEALEKAETPAPLRPALTRALVDAWSMTSLDEHAGRPDIQPWLRGWDEDDKPQTQIVWRTHLPVRRRGSRETSKEIDEFFEAAPPHTSEVLEAETWRVVEWLLKRASSVLKAQEKAARDGDPQAVAKDRAVLLVLNNKNELEEGKGPQPQWSLGRLAGLEKKERKKDRESFEAGLRNRTIVVDALLAGLSGAGMLYDGVDEPPPAIDTDALDTAGAEDKWPLRPFAILETDQAGPPRQSGWKPLHRFALEKDEDGNANRWLVVFERTGRAATEEGRALSRQEQALTDHQAEVAWRVQKTAEAIGLPLEYVSALTIAARLHDEGKRVWRWQRAFNAPRDDVYAKTRGPLNTKLLDGYRHEFASLWKVEEDPGFKQLDPKVQDFVLHLVAAHHGYARPAISTRNCEESGREEKAREVALRFARLQKRWGPWGLAWWESLLRAADQQASRNNDARGDQAAEAGSVPGTTGEAA